MAEKVSYKQGTKATYLGLASRSATALYFCTDTKELYKGDDLYSDGLRTVETYDMLPAFLSAADGIVYYCKDTGCGYVLNETRDGWTQVIFGVDNETIMIGANGLMQVKAIPLSAIPGLEDRLDKIEQDVSSGGGQAAIATHETAGIVKPSDEFEISEDGAMSISAIALVKVTGLEERLGNIEAAQAGGVHYKGSVPTVDDLPTDAQQGDLYEVTADNSEWCYNGESWFSYGSTNAAELKPIAQADINTAQFDLTENVLSIKNIDSGIVSYGAQTLDEALNNMAAAITWESMDDTMV